MALTITLHRPVASRTSRAVPGTPGRPPLFTTVPDRVAFGAKVGKSYAQGMPVDRQQVEVAKVALMPGIRAEVTALNQRNLRREFPAIDRAFRELELDDAPGLPPLVLRMGHSLKTAGGGLASVLVSLVGKLPPAHTVEEAIAQIEATTEALSETAYRNLSRHPKLGQVYPPDWLKAQARMIGLGAMKAHEPYHNDYYGGSFIFDGPELPGLKDLAHTSLQTGHIVFIGATGALQIVALPKASAWQDILLRHPILSESLRRNPPDLIDLALMPGSGDRLADLCRLLAETDKPDSPLVDPTGYSPLHSMLQHVPIPWPDLIRRDRLTCLLDKPDAAGHSLWDGLESSVERRFQRAHTVSPPGRMKTLRDFLDKYFD